MVINFRNIQYTQTSQCNTTTPTQIRVIPFKDINPHEPESCNSGFYAHANLSTAKFEDPHPQKIKMIHIRAPHQNKPGYYILRIYTHTNQGTTI